MSTKTLVCRICKTLPEEVVVEGQLNRLRCPRCGISGEREHVLKLANEYMSHQLIEEHQKALQRMTQRSKFIQYRKGYFRRLTPPTFVYE